MKTFNQSPRDPVFVQDPYPTYSKMRAAGHFVFWADYDLPVATTSAAVNAVLKSRKFGRELPSDRRVPVPDHLAAFASVEMNSMLELEPPVHTRLRGLVLRAFTRNRIAGLAPEISMISDALIDTFPKDRPFDLNAKFARLLPVLVISRFLGVPDDMAEQLLAWSNAMVSMYQARRDHDLEVAADTAAREFSDYMRGHIERRRTEPRDDLLSELIAAEEDGERLTTDEMISTCILLLNAGHEATVNSIGNAFIPLVDFPERKSAIQPEHVGDTVEECLRFDPPLHMFTRYLYEDIVLLDQHFRAGQEVGCLLGSACHDDAIWPDAARFDPFRTPHPNAAFGAGIHFCVGAPLARMELQMALPILFARCPKIALVEEPRVADLFHFRGREKLMVTLQQGE